jgi:hypothetical protein
MFWNKQERNKEMVAGQAYQVIRYLVHSLKNPPDEGYEVDKDEIIRALNYFSQISAGIIEPNEEFLPFCLEKRINKGK